MTPRHVKIGGPVALCGQSSTSDDVSLDDARREHARGWVGALVDCPDCRTLIATYVIHTSKGQ